MNELFMAAFIEIYGVPLLNRDGTRSDILTDTASVNAQTSPAIGIESWQNGKTKISVSFHM